MATCSPATPSTEAPSSQRTLLNTVMDFLHPPSKSPSAQPAQPARRRPSCGALDPVELRPSNARPTVLGEGGYGLVYLGQNCDTGETVAVKVIDSSKCSEAAVVREISALRKCAAQGHPNICGLRDYRTVGDKHYIVMERCGSELFKQVEERGAIAEERARGYFAGMLSGLRFMHENGVVHRDLKLENVMLDAATGTVPKIVDLGLAHAHQRGPSGDFAPAPLSQWCGSRSYCAPEVMGRLAYNGFAADIWSLGVCLFAMTCGFFPVEEATPKDWRFVKLAQAQFPERFAGSSCGAEAAAVAAAAAAAGPVSTTRLIFSFYGRTCPLSAELVALLDGLLCLDPRARLTLDQVVDSAWVRMGAPAPPAPTATAAGPPAARLATAPTLSSMGSEMSDVRWAEPEGASGTGEAAARADLLEVSFGEENMMRSVPGFLAAECEGPLPAPPAEAMALPPPFQRQRAESSL